MRDTTNYTHVDEDVLYVKRVISASGGLTAAVTAVHVEGKLGRAYWRSSTMGRFLLIYRASTIVADTSVVAWRLPSQRCMFVW